MERVTLEDLRMKMAEFARERDWDQFHSPRNLLLALFPASFPSGSVVNAILFLHVRKPIAVFFSDGEIYDPCFCSSLMVGKNGCLVEAKGIFLPSFSFLFLLIYCIFLSSRSTIWGTGKSHSRKVGEVGELSEIFQWRGEVPRGLPGWEESHKEHLGEELSDVLLYLIRLSDICGIDLSRAALRKMQLNAIKYPVKHCKGSSRKHNHYSETATATTTTNSAAATPPLDTTGSVSGDVTSTDGSKKIKNICNGGGAEEVAAAAP